MAGPRAASSTTSSSASCSSTSPTRWRPCAGCPRLSAPAAAWPW